ncbi:MAG: DJ-1/PfpI family protein, partial [Chloroflexi bacterium]|nr:DJ-1/PfpI family protein [Chloroflexota bacterium]
MKTRTVGILIFNDVEVLDFCGPFEVFAVTPAIDEQKPFQVFIIAEKESPVIARNGLSVNPHYAIHNCPSLDILLVPGGMGTRKEMNNEYLTGWIKQRYQQLELLLSVCTGAMLLAKAGLLKGLEATTHHGAIDLLREVAPGTLVHDNKRFIDNGKIITSAGIS